MTKVFYENNNFPITYDPTTDTLECIGFCDLCPAKDPRHKTFEDCKNYYARVTATSEKLHELAEKRINILKILNKIRYFINALDIRYQYFNIMHKILNHWYRLKVKKAKTAREEIRIFWQHMTRYEMPLMRQINWYYFRAEFFGLMDALRHRADTPTDEYLYRLLDKLIFIIEK